MWYNNDNNIRIIPNYIDKLKGFNMGSRPDGSQNNIIDIINNYDSNFKIRSKKEILDIEYEDIIDVCIYPIKNGSSPNCVGFVM